MKPVRIFLKNSNGINSMTEMSQKEKTMLEKQKAGFDKTNKFLTLLNDGEIPAGLSVKEIVRKVKIEEWKFFEIVKKLKRAGKIQKAKVGDKNGFVVLDPNLLTEEEFIEVSKVNFAPGKKSKKKPGSRSVELHKGNPTGVLTEPFNISDVIEGEIIDPADRQVSVTFNGSPKSVADLLKNLGRN